MSKPKTVAEFQKEFSTKQIDFNSIHDEMQAYLDGYEHNFYYRQRSNVVKSVKIGVNLVQVFADKLWHHTSEFPKIHVPSTPDDRDNAEIREKVLIATHQKNNTDLLWGEWTFDGAVMGGAVARTVFNLKKRCVEISRHDPRRAYWQRSGNGEVTVFWTATPMTREAIEEKYGVKLTEAGMSGQVYDFLLDGEQVPIDEKDYFLVVTRDDAEMSCEFVGNQFLKSPYKHLQGGIPVDLAIPYKTASNDNRPAFYLSKLKELQAEFNEMWRRRANVVRKLGNPLVYGRGIYKNNEQEIKKQMRADGGFVALKENGELALLSVPETAMIDNALMDCFARMKDVAGFPTATFGESVGANTSGDALGMYFTPTQKMVNHYNKSYKAFLQGINSKILRAYYEFGKINEEFELFGYNSHASIRTTVDGTMKSTKGDGMSVKFTKEQIGSNYTNVVTPSAVTPKDDIGYKRFILDAVTNKMMSRTTGLDEIGILSPADEFALLQQEAQDPFLNPEGTANVMDHQMGGMEQDGVPIPTKPAGGFPEEQMQPQVPTPQELMQGV
jgi:hypothetical protein